MHLVPGASRASILAGFCALLCIDCGSSRPTEPVPRISPIKAEVSASAISVRPMPSAATSAASVPRALPPCDEAATAQQEIEVSKISPLTDWVLVLRKTGCIETWDIKQKKRMAVVALNGAEYRGEYGLRYAFRSGALVMAEKSAFTLPNLQSIPVPATVDTDANEPVLYKNGARGIKNWDPKLAKAVEKWIKFTTVSVRQEGERTWLQAADKDGIEHSTDISPDGKLFCYDGRLVRLDTGAYRDFTAWTDSYTAMSGETFPGRIAISLGPRSDRAEILSTARMGAGPDITSSQLVDAKLMKPIAPMTTACNMPFGTWSPRGKWIVRENCDHGVIEHNAVATDADNGKIVRSLPSRYNSYADDDDTVVSEHLVMNLRTGEVLFEVPHPKAE